MSALWIELKKGFTNEGVVHELSWIPGVQTGALLFTIRAMIGIDLPQKSLNRSKRFLFPACDMRFFANLSRKNHLVEEIISASITLIVINVR
ncbi:hypothetical protein [Cedecea neteri]|uniref:hypothetical protein n=1 Tax=Cedecea neteri TaxID=158822 RepID=UPI001392461B|nr:hypothetical protein [Cedecea neteri]